MRGPPTLVAPRCANFKRICDLMRRRERTKCQKSAPKQKRSHISGSFLRWAARADASQPLGSRGERCLVHHDFVQRSKIGRADNARYLGWAVTSCLRDLLVRLKRIFQDREQDPIMSTMVTGIGTFWHCWAPRCWLGIRLTLLPIVPLLPPRLQCCSIQGLACQRAYDPKCTKRD
jgi:hypothetical protein